MTPRPSPRPGSPEPCVALVPIFSRLSPQQQSEVAAYARPLDIARGDALVRSGQERPRLFVVHSGSVKLATCGPDGRETIVQVLGPGDVGGETSFLTGAPPDEDAVALTATRACVFDPADLADLIQRHPGIGVAMLRTLAERLAAARRMLAARTLAAVGARVAAYLLDCPANWGQAGIATVRLPLPKKDVATLLGTSPETFSRRLASFERDGLIRLRATEVDILDPAGLEAVARGA